MTKFAQASLALASISRAALSPAICGTVRADGSNPVEAVARLGHAFEEFKAADAQAQKDKDVILQQKLDRLNDELSTMSAQVEAANNRIVNAIAAPGTDVAPNPEYTQDFRAYMRSGNVSAVLRENTETDGGVLAPPEWDRTITGKLKLLSPIRGNSQVISVSGSGFTRVFTDRLLGSGWVGEETARPATTTPGFSKLAWSFGEIFAQPAVTQTLLDDAEIDMESWLASEVESEFAVQENAAFLTGDGVNKPRGVLNYVTGGTMAATHPFGAISVKQAASATVLDSSEIIDLIYSLPSEREMGSKLFLNRTTVGMLRKLKDTTGNFLWQPNYQAGEPSTLAGVPVVEVAGMPVPQAGSIPILYGNMEKTYLVVDRKGTFLIRDHFTNKPNIILYSTRRVGGGVQNPEYMKALKMA